MAIASLGIANEVREVAGETKAITATYEKCKMMLIPIPSYEILVGLVLQRRTVLDEYRLVNRIESLVEDNTADSGSSSSNPTTT